MVDALRILRILGTAVTVALLAVACSPDSGAMAPGPRSVGLNGFAVRQGPPIRSWMSPYAKREKLLYASDALDNIIDVFSVPNYSLVGQITNDIAEPIGITTDKHGNLYVANVLTGAVTVYAQGQTTSKLTLGDHYGPEDVAVTKNDYVVVGDMAGGVSIYAPGQTSAKTRLTSPSSTLVTAVGVDAHNNVYATTFNYASQPIVIEFRKLKGSGTNLGLTGLDFPEGVLVDNSGDLVVSDSLLPGVNIYPPGQTSPSATIANSESPLHSALNKAENLIYVPEGIHGVNVYDYPSGTLVTTIGFTGSGYFIEGTALSPAPKP